MKLKFIIILLVSNLFVSSQINYSSLILEAEKLYSTKDYGKSTTKYQEAFRIEQKNTSDLYNGACSAALSGQAKIAFEWLNLAIKKGWENKEHLKKDPDLNSLHEDKRWNELISYLQKEIDKREMYYDKPLQNKLLSIFNDDQNIRQQFSAAQKRFGYQSKQADSIGKIMRHQDSIDLIKVKEILDTYGWVGADKVGRQGNETLFLVIQHSDLETQKKYLPMMRQAVKKKNATPSSLALLEDRVALRQGKMQIYGSQIGVDEETGKMYVLPLEDPDNVDKRRAEVGLDPIASYVKNWDIIWNVEEYKKLLPVLILEQKK
mgnify:FL=1